MPRTSCAAGNVCTPTSVSVDTTNNFNTIVIFSNNLDAQSDGTEMTLSVTKGPTVKSTVQNHSVIFTLGKMDPGEYTFALFIKNNVICGGAGGTSSFIVPDNGQGGTVSQVRGPISFSPSQPTPNDKITVTVTNLTKNGDYFISASQQGVSTNSSSQCLASNNNQLTATIGPFKEGRWLIYVAEKAASSCMASDNGIASGEINISQPIKSTPTPPPGPCGNGEKCPTAFGDIQTDPTGFIKSIFGIILSLAGGIAIILIMIAGYRLMSSQGNPEKVQTAREQLTSAIVGLLFIIFSVTILQIIGVDILHIPGFGR